MNSQAASAKIEELVKELSSSEDVQRMSARAALVDLGSAAVPAVSGLAYAADDHTRWECAKTLASIADPSSVDTLIQLLEDADEGTRWDAALGLIAIGKPSVTPLLRAIVHRSKEYTIVGGARHVMHELSKTDWGGFLRPVYEDLNSSVARESAPCAAHNALQEWEYSELGR